MHSVSKYGLTDETGGALLNVTVLNFTDIGRGDGSYLIGRVRKITVEKCRPSTSQVLTGRSPVTFCAGSPESDHSGVLPAKFRWSGT